MLYVFEGPDSVGKSTVSAAFAERLTGAGHRTVRHWSFPGREEGTLGWAVYRLHHKPQDLGVTRLTATSLQVMHIAAHVDAIESRILPAIDAGDVVVLDRFWWSTLVYGIVGGAPVEVLDAMIDIERRAWRGVVPTAAFLVDRGEPFKLRHDERMGDWRRLKQEYARLAERESHDHPVVRVVNDGPVSAAVDAAEAAASR